MGIEFLMGAISGLIVVIVWKTVELFNKLDKTIDDVKNDIEILKTERDYYKEELERWQKWKDWLPEDPEDNENNLKIAYEFKPKSKEEVFSGERKYDPNKIKGAFDGLFGSSNSSGYQPEAEGKSKPPSKE